MNDTPLDVSPPKYPGFLVLATGMGTAGLALLLQYLLELKADFNAIGFYVYEIVPIGAVVLGVLAGSGYGLASWLSGAKIAKRFYVAIIVLQITAYVIAQYILYAMYCLATNNEPGFFVFFDAVTQGLAWRDDQGNLGAALGLWGYGVRGLEVFGFVVGGLILPAALASMAYCDGCHVYMKSNYFGRLPAGVVPRKIKSRDVAAKEAYEAELTAAAAQGTLLVEGLVGAIGAADATTFLELFAPHRATGKASAKLTSRVDITLRRCPCCRNGLLHFQWICGSGDKTTITHLATCPADATFIDRLLND
jgi:hypothetical protein